MADGIGHGENGQPKGKGHAQQSDAHVWKCGRQDSAATSPENEPERADEFRRRSFAQRHKESPCVPGRRHPPTLQTAADIAAELVSDAVIVREDSAAVGWRQGPDRSRPLTDIRIATPSSFALWTASILGSRVWVLLIEACCKSPARSELIPPHPGL